MFLYDVLFHFISFFYPNKRKKNITQKAQEHTKHQTFKHKIYILKKHKRQTTANFFNIIFHSCFSGKEKLTLATNRSHLYKIQNAKHIYK